MTKKIFVENLVSKVDGLSKKDAALMIDAVGEVITEALVAGEDITIPGVGKFATKKVPEKTGKITFGDRKGEAWVSPAHTAPTFKVSTSLKNAVK